MASYESDPRKARKMRAKPKAVRTAIVSDDLEALRAMQRRSTEVQNTNRQKAAERSADEKEYYEEKAAAQDDTMRRDANEHIVPIDPDETKEAA